MTSRLNWIIKSFLKKVTLVNLVFESNYLISLLTYVSYVLILYLPTNCTFACTILFFSP